MSEAEMVPVTDEDREAAADWHQSQGHWIVDWHAMRRGEMDDSGTVQAFARHRLAAEAAAIERCAEIVGRDRRSEGAIKCGYIPKAQEVCWELATAIRSLKEGASHVG